MEIELKEWLDLNDALVRAKIARHLAALANHGGGWIIFGFKDDLSKDENRPISLDEYSHDTFSAIIKRYLTPTFECDVSHVADKNDDRFAVIRVPSHDRVPIAARADGPASDKGRIQGINSGTYYIRKPGPESAPIIGADEWAALIRRCLLNDRDSLLSDISKLVQTPAPTQVEPAASQQLEYWHREAEERFLQLLPQAKGLQWRVPVNDNRYQLSYLITTSDHQTLPEDSLRKVLEEINNEVRNTVWTGWSMFFPFSSPEISPAFHAERPDGTGQDVLEANLMGDGNFDMSLPDFWRIAPDGRVTIIRTYREDRERSVKDSGRAAGAWISPETIMRETTELVTHAKLFARRFDAATKVSFRCTWIGLKGREIADFDSSIYWSRGYISKASQRTVDGEWSTAQLAANWSTIVSELGCPILRLFNFPNCGPVFVDHMKSRFVKL